MSNQKKKSFGGKLLLGLIEIVIAIAILFFVVKALPKDLQDMTITSIGSGISQSLLITTPEPEDEIGQEDTEITTPAPSPVTLMTSDPTLEPTEVLENTDEEQGEVAFPTEEPTEIPTEVENSDETGDLTSETEDGLETDPTEAPVTDEEETLVSTARTSSITISAAGDCTLGGDTTNGGYNRFKKVYDANGEEYFFANVKEIFEADDITIVNLEGALTKTDSRKDKTFSFRGDPAFGKILTAGSVEVVSIDNNHSQDYYSQGLADTKKSLDFVDVGYAGLGTTYSTTVEGVNIGFLSYRVWEMDIDKMVSDIQTMKQENDLVVVSIHWGDEKVGKASKQQIKLGHAAVDAGADLVLGHHPHVVGSIELYNGKYIVYSLGNFCFGGNSNPEDKDTFIFQQTFNFENGEVTGTEINIIPCSVSSVSDTNNYQPTPIAYDEGGKDILKRIVKLSQQFEESGTMPDWAAVIAKMDAEAGYEGEEVSTETEDTAVVE